MRNPYTAAWPPERWRVHHLQMSESRKAQNLGKEPERKGRKRCPKCGARRSRQSFCRAVRQPGGLQHYCNACNRLHVRKHYWYQKLRTLSLTAPQPEVDAILFKAGEALPIQEVLDLIDRWIKEGRS